MSNQESANLRCCGWDAITHDQTLVQTYLIDSIPSLHNSSVELCEHSLCASPEEVRINAFCAKPYGVLACKVPIGVRTNAVLCVFCNSCFEWGFRTNPLRGVHDASLLRGKHENFMRIPSVGSQVAGGGGKNRLLSQSFRKKHGVYLHSG